MADPRERPEVDEESAPAPRSRRAEVVYAVVLLAAAAAPWAGLVLFGPLGGVLGVVAGHLFYVLIVHRDGGVCLGPAYGYFILSAAAAILVSGGWWLWRLMV
ncbi:MAG: hypothetical protein ACYTGB_04275 [Planctomycetota bacterium]